MCHNMRSFEDFNQKLADHLHLVESFHFLTLLTLGQYWKMLHRYRRSVPRLDLHFYSLRTTSPVPGPLSPPKKLTLKVCVPWSPMCSMSCLLPRLVSTVPGPLSPVPPKKLTLKVCIQWSYPPRLKPTSQNVILSEWKSRPKWSFDRYRQVHSIR